MKKTEELLKSLRTQEKVGLERPIVNPQQALPLAKFALESHALGHPKCRDDAALDLLAALSGVIAR